MHTPFGLLSRWHMELETPVTQAIFDFGRSWEVKGQL